MDPTEDEIKKVLEALNNDRFKWRTVKGIASESNLNPDVVVTVIKSQPDAIVRSNVRSTKGDELYTSRGKLGSVENTMTRLLGAFKGRAT
jgi:hypothetical protein